MNENRAGQDLRAIGHPLPVTIEDPLTWLSRIANKLRTLSLARTYPFASFGKGSWAHYTCHVSRAAARHISIGKGVGFGRDVRLDVCAALGKDSPVLILEDGCGLQRRVVVSARNRIHIMRNAIFGPSVLLIDHGGDVEGGADSAVCGPQAGGGTIRIEEECWIGFGATIICEQGELVIGRHSVVGANSVVKRSIPPYSVVSGDPARIVKQYDFSKGKWVLGCVRSAESAERQVPDPMAGALS
jgi:acetyltransferase-like isoleucine patch superfamily enzyme